MIVVLTFIVAAFAFCISAVAGGGAGLVLVPLLRMMLPMAQVPAALSIGTATGSIARIHAFRSHIRWDIVRLFAPAAFPMAALGAWALSRFEPAYAELLIGLFLLANLGPMLRRSSKRHAQTPDLTHSRPINRSVILLLGAAAGLISGFTGAVGLLFNGTYLRMGMSKEQLVATRAANEVAIHVLKIILYALFGLLSPLAMLIGAVVATAAVLSAYIMRWLLPRVKQRLFLHISNVATVAAGTCMFLMSSQQIMTVHRAWASIVQAGDDEELHVYWETQRRFVFEFTSDSGLSIDRRVDYHDLSTRQKAAVDRLAGRGQVILLQKSYSLHGSQIEARVRMEDRVRRVVIE